MSEWLVSKKPNIVLEPTAGDGVFIDALHAQSQSTQWPLKIVAVEIDEKACNEISSKEGIEIHCSDFHTFSYRLVDGVIGNPPFVRFRNLTVRNREAASKAAQKSIGNRLDLSGSIWMSIVLHSLGLLRVKGNIAFVLPTDALYVRYARPFWEILAKNFSHIRIVRCSERLFPEILQDVILLFAEDFGGSTTTVSCEDFDSFSDLQKGKTQRTTSVRVDEILSGSKPFIRALLSEDQRSFVEDLHSRCHSASALVKFNIGYVSGNKTFFHPNKDVIKRFKLPQKSLRPAVVTARRLSGTSFLTSQLQQSMELLWLPNPGRLTKGEVAYIDFGEKSGVGDGRKTSNRHPWFVVPSVVIPDIMLTVFGELPRLLINDLEVPASNSILVGRFHDHVDRDKLLMIWYSSITRLGIELAVHSLGGGVLVLVPREADAIMIPRIPEIAVSPKLLTRLGECLERNDLASAYRVGDDYLLTAGWQQDELTKALHIANKLQSRRSRKPNESSLTKDSSA
jgi:hypothetical protein